MAKEKKTLKFQMMMSPEEAETLDDWMFRNRVRSRAEAIRRLWQMALDLDDDLPAAYERLDAMSKATDKLMRDIVSVNMSDFYKKADDKNKDLIDSVYNSGIAVSNSAYLCLLDALELYNRSMPFAVKRSLSSAKRESRLNAEEVQQERFLFQTMIDRDYPGKVMQAMSADEKAAFYSMPFDERQELMSRRCEEMFAKELAAGYLDSRDGEQTEES